MLRAAMVDPDHLVFVVLAGHRSTQYSAVLGGTRRDSAWCSVVLGGVRPGTRRYSVVLGGTWNARWYKGCIHASSHNCFVSWRTSFEASDSKLQKSSWQPWSFGHKLPQLLCITTNDSLEASDSKLQKSNWQPWTFGRKLPQLLCIMENLSQSLRLEIAKRAVGSR